MSLKYRLFAQALGAVCLAGVLAACGSSSSGSKITGTAYNCSAPNSGSSLTKVTVSALPIVSNGALYLGVDQGFFKQNGLDVSIKPIASVAAGIAAVQGGSTNFGYAPTISVLQAVGNGVPIKIAAPFAGMAPGYYDKMKAGVAGYTTEVSALVTMKGSGIDEPKQLDGKSVALIDVKGQSELTTRYVIDSDGGKSTTVHFVNMSLADGLNAFLAHKVDAIFTADPFLTKAVAGGGQVISWVGVEALHQGPTSVMVAATSYIAKHQDTVARFNCAIRTSDEFANTHHDLVRQVIASAEKVSAASLAHAVVAYFYSCADVSGLNRFKSLMNQYSFLAKDFNISDVLIPEDQCTEPTINYSPQA